MGGASRESGSVISLCLIPVPPRRGMTIIPVDISWMFGVNHREDVLKNRASLDILRRNPGPSGRYLILTRESMQGTVMFSDGLRETLSHAF